MKDGPSAFCLNSNIIVVLGIRLLLTRLLPNKVWAGSAFMISSASFDTWMFLAGIYPVGMEIAPDWHMVSLGKALVYNVWALVIGTAFPQLLKFPGSPCP